jgi:hypothetical protein
VRLSKATNSNNNNNNNNTISLPPTIAGAFTQRFNLVTQAPL